MNIMVRFLLAKMAAEAKDIALPAPHVTSSALLKAEKKLVKAVDTGKISKDEFKQIKKTVKAIKPKSKEERQLRSLSGAPYTKGQYKRYAAIAGGAGLATHFAGRVIGGGRVPWVVAEAVPGTTESIARRIGRGMIKGETMISPRQLARAAVIGGIYGAMMPTVKRLADIQAAKKGQF